MDNADAATLCEMCGAVISVKIHFTIFGPIAQWMPSDCNCSRSIEQLIALMNEAVDAAEAAIESGSVNNARMN